MVIFLVGSVYGSAFVAFNLGSARLLLSIMGVWIFDRNVLFNTTITPLHPSRRADVGIISRLVLPARLHKATRLYRIGIRATSR